MQSIRVKSPDLPLTLFRPVQWKSVESGSAGQTEGSQHSALFLFLMNQHSFSRHQNPLTTSLQHTLIRVIYCFSSHILQLCEPFLKARVPTFSFIFLILFPHLCLVSSSFKSEYKCHLPFAAHLINPPTLLAPQNMSPPSDRTRLVLCTIHSTRNRRSCNFMTSLVTGQGARPF